MVVVVVVMVVVMVMVVVKQDAAGESADDIKGYPQQLTAFFQNCDNYNPPRYKQTRYILYSSLFQQTTGA